LFFLGLPGFSFLIFLWLSLAGLLKLSLSGLLWLTTTLIGELYGLERLLSLMAIPISKAGLRSRLLLKINFYTAHGAILFEEKCKYTLSLWFWGKNTFPHSVVTLADYICGGK
jgi:hypothetical protein